MADHSSRRSITASILISLFFLYSCFPDHYDLHRISGDVGLTPGIAAPLAYGTLSIEDILNRVDTNSYVRQFDDSLLYLTYVENLMSYPASEVIDIPDQQFLQLFISPDINIPAWLFSSMGDTVNFTKEKNSEFIFTHNERIDSIHVKTATLNINVSSSFRQTGILTIHSDHILVDGKPFREVIQISDDIRPFQFQ